MSTISFKIELPASYLIEGDGSSWSLYGPDKKLLHNTMSFQAAYYLYLSAWNGWSPMRPVITVPAFITLKL